MKDIEDRLREQAEAIERFMEGSRPAIERLLKLIEENKKQSPTIPTTDRRKRRAAKRSMQHEA